MTTNNPTTDDETSYDPNPIETAVEHALPRAAAFILAQEPRLLVTAEELATVLSLLPQGAGLLKLHTAMRPELAVRHFNALLPLTITLPRGERIHICKEPSFKTPVYSFSGPERD